MRFTDHAKYRLFMERGISADAVKSAILEPDNIAYLAGGLVKCAKRRKAVNLMVVYKKEKNVFVIITAYFK